VPGAERGRKPRSLTGASTPDVARARRMPFDKVRRAFAFSQPRDPRPRPASDSGAGRTRVCGLASSSAAPYADLGAGHFPDCAQKCAQIRKAQCGRFGRFPLNYWLYWRFLVVEAVSSEPVSGPPQRFTGNLQRNNVDFGCIPAHTPHKSAQLRISQAKSAKKGNRESWALASVSNREPRSR
jgi:hypothetical protein